MLSNSKVTTSSLSQQLDRVRNYYQHRQRVEHTNKIHPLAQTKKSMSYDRQKIMKHQYIKQRRIYTNYYNKKETLRNNEEKDARMLQNILEYDQKQFVFSLNSHRKTNSSLHHNSMVSNNQQNRVIDLQNQKIHFRISKAKSLYSHWFPNKQPWRNINPNNPQTVYRPSQIRIHKGQEKQQKQSQNEWQVDKEESLTESKSYFELSHKLKLPYESKTTKRTYTALALSGTYIKPQNTLQASSAMMSSSLTNRKMCERVRRERLAQQLFDRKKQWQKSIQSKLQIKRT